MKTWKTARRRIVFAVGIAAMATFVGAGAVSGSTGSVSKAKAGPLVAFLLPENVTPRWEGSDAPTFKKALAKLRPGRSDRRSQRAERLGASSRRRPRPS